MEPSEYEKVATVMILMLITFILLYLIFGEDKYELF